MGNKWEQTEHSMGQIVAIFRAQHGLSSIRMSIDGSDGSIRVWRAGQKQIYEGRAGMTPAEASRAITRQQRQDRLLRAMPFRAA